METVDAQEALQLLIRPTRTGGGPGRSSAGLALVQQFLDTGALFGRERFANEKERKAKMLSVKQAIKARGWEDRVWVVADGHSILFTNMEIASQQEAETRDAITAQFNAFKARYEHVGRKASPAKATAKKK